MLCLSCLFLISHFTNPQFRMLLTLSYLAMSGCLLTFPVPCGFNQLHLSCLWSWDLSSDQCLAVLPPNWVSAPGDHSWLTVVPDCKSTVRQYAASRHSAWSRDSNCEPSWQQKDTAQVSEPTNETRALYFDLIPHTEVCVSDQITVFSTRNARSAGIWTSTVARILH